jgi:hypothetical protein
VQDVLAQAERSSHHDGIKKGGLLESHLTPTSLRPNVCDNNLCQESVHRSKSTDIDLGV